MEKTYIAPQIETIEIDNEISVIMMSELTPPDGPYGSINIDEKNLEPDVFKV